MRDLHCAMSATPLLWKEMHGSAKGVVLLEKRLMLCVGMTGFLTLIEQRDIFDSDRFATSFHYQILGMVCQYFMF
jgi:hypothetical protein